MRLVALVVLCWVVGFSSWASEQTTSSVTRQTETTRIQYRHIREATAPITRRIQLTPVPIVEIASSARQVTFLTVGTSHTVQFLVTDEVTKEPIPGIRLTPIVVSEPEGTYQHMEIYPHAAITDEAGFVGFEIFGGDQPGRYSLIMFQNRPGADEIIYTRLELIVQDANWATMLVLSLVGGLAIFLYGLKTASEGLQSLTGSNLRENFADLTRTPLRGMLVGFALTTLTQSSGATTAILMSFVRAGFVTFANSVGVILGAAISGTITAQLIALNLFSYALPAVAVGFFTYLIGQERKKRRAQAAGLAILGFGLVFLGMKTMTDQMTPLKLFSWFTDAVQGLANHPVWAVIISFVFTTLAQSSGAIVGIVISLARQDLLSLPETIPFFFGAAIGASTTGFAAAVGASPEARRVALAHFIYKVAGVILFLPFVPQLAAFGMWVTKYLFFYGLREGADADIVARAVANTYTLFMVITAFLAVPFIPQLERLCFKLIPQQTFKGPVTAKYLELRVTDAPEVSLGAMRREVSRMGRFVEEMMLNIREALFERNLDVIPFILERDKKVDMVTAEFTKFLVEFTRRPLPEKYIREATAFLLIVNNLESIGDIIDKNMVPLAYKLTAVEGRDFSPEGKYDLMSLHSAVAERLSMTVIALSTRENSLAKRIVNEFAVLQREGKELHYNHLHRLQNNIQESFETSSIHLDVINYLLRIDFLLFDTCLELLSTVEDSKQQAAENPKGQAWAQ